MTHNEKLSTVVTIYIPFVLIKSQIHSYILFRRKKLMHIIIICEDKFHTFYVFNLISL